MASIFTYEHEPPRVDSPWTRGSHLNRETGDESNGEESTGGEGNSAVSTIHQTKLQAEPQEGPVEYKLHLLLGPRRKFIYTSTSRRVPRSKHSDPGNSNENSQPTPGIASITDAESTSDLGSPSTAYTYQTRHHRLQQLTTQLLWRLQQSSPHHASSATNFILPFLPEPLPELQAPQSPAKLLHGLEESLGALYEIGVADDGTLVGLAEDEMSESLNNLRAMAACLGCTVDILRKEVVGQCERAEPSVSKSNGGMPRRVSDLLVVEALVKPYLHPPESETQETATSQPESSATTSGKHLRMPLDPATEQLRITLTGPTMSGKSSLLGTLTMSTLDNGRGKSRISMLKHRHEISSGVTSSVTQELIGYADDNDGSAAVVNYAAANIASWIDIHVGASVGRLILISDSAGHPRYRRTTIRGLVGCAPHWTVLCVPADDTETVIGKSGNTFATKQQPGSGIVDMNLSGAQLELCLRLGLPLIVAITKLDVASKSGLKETLTKVLDALKAADRKPAILANQAKQVSELDLQTVQSNVIDDVYGAVLPLLNNPLSYVPIVLTSALQGTGISNLHALLHELPTPTLDALQDVHGNMVFHIEDIYNRPLEDGGVIVAGRVRSGKVSIGDILTIGPFSTHELEDSEDSDERSIRRPYMKLPTSRSFPGALATGTIAKPHFHLSNQEWRRIRVTSIRNLRLPVHSLHADQIGTIAIGAADKDPRSAAAEFSSSIRKGMVLTAIQPLAVRTFVAQFKREDLGSLAVGNHVVVYIASVRASARIISARAPDSPDLGRKTSIGDDTFDFDDIRAAVEETDGASDQKVAGSITAHDLLVTLTFDASKEFVAIDDQVLVMPGGGPGLYGGHERGEKGLAGLEGFVGRIKEIYG